MGKLTKFNQMRDLALRSASDARRLAMKLAEEKQNKLTGAMGQVVGFNAKGEPEAQSTHSLTGPAGADGKSAYQYAVDGGYKGTEAEFQALLNSIPNKQDALTGQAGQVVGFDADGAAVAVSGWSNPNLLDNAYWANRESIMNQKEQEEYTNNGYTIDRWYVAQRDYGTSLTVDETGVTLDVTSKGTDSHGVFIGQFFPFLKVGTYTFSVLVSQANGSAVMGVDQNAAPWAKLSKEILLKEGLNTVTFTIKNDEGKVGFFLAKTVIDVASFKFVAAKLELGSQQTLARQDASGNWVLNDPPPNKAMELLKCQRYFYRLKNSRYRMATFTGGNNGARFQIELPITMAKTPALSFHANNDDIQWIRTVDNVGIYKLSEIDQKYVGEFNGNSIAVSLILPAAITDAHLYVDGYIDFDSNL